jgi:excisionase family DNA binding protein
MLPQFAEDLLNGANEAAEFTGLSRRTIYHLVEQNQIPFSRMGARLYFRKSALNISFGGLSPLEPLGHDNQNDRNQTVNV